MVGSVGRLRRLLQLLMDDQMDISQFQRHFRPVARDIEIAGSDAALRLALRVEHRLAEFSKAGISRKRLIGALVSDFRELTGIEIVSEAPSKQ